MVQLEILNGKMAGGLVAARRFPFTIGRAKSAQLQLEEPGVWDKHAVLRLVPREGIHVDAQADTLVSVNDAPVETSPLKNGDRIEVGSVRLRFWLAAPRQRGLRFREAMVWTAVVVVTAFQLAVMYWLAK